MLSPTMFEDANEERVVTLNVPPGGRWVVLWLGQIEAKRPGASGVGVLGGGRKEKRGKRGGGKRRRERRGEGRERGEGEGPGAMRNSYCKTFAKASFVYDQQITSLTLLAPLS